MNIICSSVKHKSNCICFTCNFKKSKKKKEEKECVGCKSIKLIRCNKTMCENCWNKENE